MREHEGLGAGSQTLQEGLVDSETLPRMQN